MPKKIISSMLAIIFAFIVLTGFTRPAFAWTDAEFRSLGSYEELAFIPNGEISEELVKALLSGFAAAFGGVLGTMAACYAVDVLIAPVNPPAAGYLATLCPGIGATVGGAGGFVGTNTVLNQ